jgi:hypothetical protein
MHASVSQQRVRFPPATDSYARIDERTAMAADVKVATHDGQRFHRESAPPIGARGANAKSVKDCRLKPTERLRPRVVTRIGITGGGVDMADVMGAPVKRRKRKPKPARKAGAGFKPQQGTIYGAWSRPRQ